MCNSWLFLICIKKSALWLLYALLGLCEKCGCSVALAQIYKQTEVMSKQEQHNETGSVASSFSDTLYNKMK